MPRASFWDTGTLSSSSKKKKKKKERQKWMLWIVHRIIFSEQNVIYFLPFKVSFFNKYHKKEDVLSLFLIWTLSGKLCWIIYSFLPFKCIAAGTFLTVLLYSDRNKDCSQQHRLITHWMASTVSLFLLSLVLKDQSDSFTMTSTETYCFKFDITYCA